MNYCVLCKVNKSLFFCNSIKFKSRESGHRLQLDKGKYPIISSHIPTTWFSWQDRVLLCPSKAFNETGNGTFSQILMSPERSAFRR